MKPSEAKKWLKEKNIKFILAQFVDIHGTAKSKAVPSSHYDDLVGAGAGFAGFAMWGFGMGPEGPDYMAVGEPGRICELPWSPALRVWCAMAMCMESPIRSIRASC